MVTRARFGGSLRPGVVDHRPFDEGHPFGIELSHLQMICQGSPSAGARRPVMGIYNDHPLIRRIVQQAYKTPLVMVYKLGESFTDCVTKAPNKTYLLSPKSFSLNKSKPAGAAHFLCGASRGKRRYLEKMKQTKTLILLHIATILIFGGSAFAQKEMSKEEALRFINQKLAELKDVKINDEPFIYVRAALVSDGNKLKLIDVKKGTAIIRVATVFDPSQMNVIKVVALPNNKVDFINIEFPTKTVKNFLGFKNDDPLVDASTDARVSVNPTDYLLINYLKGDGTAGQKLVDALSRLRHLARASSGKTSQPEGPTLEETLAFIKGKVDGTKVNYSQESGKRSFRYTQSSQVKTADGAIVTLENKIHEDLYDGRFETASTLTCSSEVTLILDEIAFDSIIVHDNASWYSLAIKPVAGKLFQSVKKCSMTGVAYRDYKTYDTARLNQTWLTFADKVTAEKVAKALKHAVKLNGGKEDLF